MPRSPRKNIWLKMMDIRPAGGRKPPDRDENPPPIDRFTPQSWAGPIRPPTSKLVRFSILFLVFFGLAGAAFLGLGFYEAVREQAAAPVYGTISPGDELGEVNSRLAALEKSLVTEGWTGALSILKSIGGSYRDLQVFSGAAFALISETDDLRAALPRLIHGQGGREVTERAERIRDQLASLTAASDRLWNNEVSGSTDVGRLAWQLQITRFKNLLDEFIPWIGEKDRRLAVFLQNPSELRPGGGFVGSYAEAVISPAGLKAFAVRDINYADRTLEEKVIPPQPLQALVTRWRAADANWFFDFALSAEKTLAFLEAAEVYKADQVEFDGAIGLSAAAVADILRLVGPVTLPAGGTITADNFLPVIQKSVQAGHDTGDPAAKKILEDLAPLLLEKMAALSAADQVKLSELLLSWGEQKELMVYFRKPAFQSLAEVYRFAGRPAALARNWFGDYLALAAANIGGGKTDIYVEQTVSLQTRIDANGELNSHLTLTRRHAGGSAEDWWYKVPNQAYLQVYVPTEAQLTYASGGFAKTIKAPVDYAAGFRADPDVAALEATARESAFAPQVTTFVSDDRKIFGTWSKIEAGREETLTFDYLRKLPVLPADGQVFEFIYEKQAGTGGKYLFEIHAPAGFRFHENGLPVFESAGEDPPGRFTLSLTLEKI